MFYETKRSFCLCLYNCLFKLNLHIADAVVSHYDKFKHVFFAFPVWSLLSFIILILLTDTKVKTIFSRDLYKLYYPISKEKNKGSAKYNIEKKNYNYFDIFHKRRKRNVKNS